MRLLRSPVFGVGMTMAVPGTTEEGEARNLSSVPASHTRWELASALVYPKFVSAAAGRPTTPASAGPCPACGRSPCPVAWQIAQFCWKSALPLTASPPDAEPVSSALAAENSEPMISREVNGVTEKRMAETKQRYPFAANQIPCEW